MPAAKIHTGVLFHPIDHGAARPGQNFDITGDIEDKFAAGGFSRLVAGAGETEVLDAVAGFSVLNDITDRVAQRAGKQWFCGKGRDGFCPMGPYLVTRDEIPDPYALTLTTDALAAYRLLGYPEGDLALVQAAVYLATAPKSNRLYRAHKQAKALVARAGALPVPLHIRNAPTRLMKNLGYGKNYKYAHNYRDAVVAQDYLPEQLKGQVFYTPSGRGYEGIVKERLDKWRRLKEKQIGTKKEVNSEDDA